LNAAPPIIVRATIGMGFTILSAAVLGFLGMGATPPDPEWGLAISESRQYLPEAWWFATFPGIAIFLVVFGGLLLVEQALPESRGVPNLVVLAAGIASLIVWALRRSTVALYAGVFLTALALPGAYEGVTGTDLGPGWGTVAFGLAFLFVALIRFTRGGGWGWQAFWGGILVLVGGSQVAKPEVANLVWPVLVVVVGLVVLAGGLRRPT